MKLRWQQEKAVGIGCAMKNAGVGVGIPDTGRVKLIYEEDKKLHIYSGASCIGQGLGTVLTQMIVSNTDIKRGYHLRAQQYLDFTRFRNYIRFQTDIDHR